MVDNALLSLVERYQRLIEISRDISSTLDLDVLLNRIVVSAAELSGSEVASILLYDQASQQLRFEAATNMDEPTMRGLVVPVESSIAGWIVIRREPIILDDVHRDPRHFSQIETATNYKTNSLLGIPLVNNDKVVGVLEVLNKRSGRFSQDDMNILTALGSMVAVAIENARLFQQSDLISELIHELRTPLASLSTASHLLLRPEISDEQKSKMVEILNDETLRLSEMTTSFLDLARLESGRAQFHMEEFDLTEVLSDCVTMMADRADEKSLKLEMKLPEPLPLMRADRDKIKQVVINLISNAIKYNRPNGSIIVSAKVEDDEMGFTVKDTGQGMLPENMTRLFEKFYRVPGAEKYASGTGLGLSICKRIVEAHRGHIEVESQIGVGTTFSVFIPMKKGKNAL